jgi:hypothetical protein
VWSDGQTGSLLNGLTAGTYSVTATEEITGCTATLDVVIDEIPGQYINDLIVLEPSCSTSGDILFTVTSDVSTMLFVFVTHPGGGETFFVAPGLFILSDQIPVLPGDYTITVQDPEQGPDCAETVTVIVPEGLSGPAISLLESIPPSGPTASDGALLIQITAFTVPPFSILVNGMLVGSTEGEVFTIGDLPSGAYSVQIVDGAGCSSNVIETFLSFTQSLVYWETQWGMPTVLRHANQSNRLEQPNQLPLSLGDGMGGQLSYQRGYDRYQLLLWSSPGVDIANRAIQMNWQKGIRGIHWAFFNGPAVGYVRRSSFSSSAFDQGTYAYWASDLSWYPQRSGRWSLDLHSALGRQDSWWWAGDLRLRFRW